MEGQSILLKSSRAARRRRDRAGVAEGLGLGSGLRLRNRHIRRDLRESHGQSTAAGHELGVVVVLHGHAVGEGSLAAPFAPISRAIVKTAPRPCSLHIPQGTRHIGPGTGPDPCH